jgi:hypothetical protein
MPAIYHEGSWLGNATDPEVLVKDTVGWTGKNLLKNKATTQTINGVTFTVNADKSVRVVANNTSVYSALTLNSNLAEILEVDKSYILTGTSIKPSGTSYRQYELRIRKNSNNDIVASDTGSGVKFTLTQAMVQADTYRLDIAIFDGTTCDTVFYPMLRKADIIDPTYEPYHESVEEEIEQIYADNGVLGAKNLYNLSYPTQTLNGITWTNNGDGTLTANGTSTATSLPNTDRFTLPKGDYIFTCPNNQGITNANNIYWFLYNVTQGKDATNILQNGQFSHNGTDILSFRVQIKGTGTTVNNLTFYPMLRLASDPDDTYQPYAMTNRELTEKVTGTIDLSQTQSTTTPEMHVERTHLEQIGKLCILSFWINRVTISETNTWKTLFKVNKVSTKNQAFSVLTGDGKIGRGMIDTNGLLTVNLFTALSNNSIIGQVMYFTN